MQTSFICYCHPHLISLLFQMLSYLLQINILLNFSAGEDCPCPEEIQEELNAFHEELRLHCGKVQQFFHYFFCPYSLKLLPFRKSPADFVHLSV